jgi:protein-disulfide isomerase
VSRKSRRNSPAPESPATAAARDRRGIHVVVIVVLLLAVLVAVLVARRPDAESSDATRLSALTREHAPDAGDQGARVHIVEFLDPACETCARFYPAVKQLIEQNPGKIRLSIRHVPFHPGSEHAVKVLEASRAQDRYWQTLEALLGSQHQWVRNHTVLPELVLPAIAAVGLDVGQLRAEMESPAVARRMAQDFSDATTLKVTATPEYFVNGRPLPSFGYQQLLDLVSEELQKSY